MCFTSNIPRDINHPKTGKSNKNINCRRCYIDLFCVCVFLFFFQIQILVCQVFNAFLMKLYLCLSRDVKDATRPILNQKTVSAFLSCKQYALKNHTPIGKLNQFGFHLSFGSIVYNTHANRNNDKTSAIIIIKRIREVIQLYVQLLKW